MWLKNRTPIDVELGLKRAKAATLMMLALPGCAYLYQYDPRTGSHDHADKQRRRARSA